jgi:hypothetical protein
MGKSINHLEHRYEHVTIILKCTVGKYIALIHFVLISFKLASVCVKILPNFARVHRIVLLSSVTQILLKLQSKTRSNVQDVTTTLAYFC